jgi:hypothetical protein
MRRAGDSLSVVSGRLSNAWAAHAGQVSGMGEIFGDDPVSSLIGASYQAAHQIAEQSYASVAASFDGFGQALHVMADGYEQTDQAEADAISSVAQEP